MPLDPLADRLLALLTDGSIVSSRVTEPMKNTLDILFRVEALVAVKSYGGKRIELRDRTVLLEWIKERYPSGLCGTEEALPPKALAVSNFGDSKRGRHTKSLAYVRGFREALLTRKDVVMRVAEFTQAFGVAAILVDPAAPWTVSGCVVLVENLELFLHIEKVVPQVSLAIWTAGRFDGRLLRWLANSPDILVLHVGDYDPVGLDEYLRFRSALASVELFIPDDLEERLRLFGKRELLQDSAAVLVRVRREADASVAKVLAVIDRHGKGLEQEGLLKKLVKDTGR